MLPRIDPSGAVLVQKRRLGFPLWGGDKTWIAPQSRWSNASPYLDLDSGPYDVEVLAGGPQRVELTLSSGVCRETGLRLRRSIRVSTGEQHFVVCHEIENANAWQIQAEIWDVAMVATPGTVYLPTWIGSAFPEGVKTYITEGQSVAARADVVQSDDGYASVTCRAGVAFKYGVDGPAGWVAAVLQRPDGGLVGYRKSMPVFLDRSYSHECVAEVYQSAEYAYLEMELHGPTVTLQPGERFAIEECHSVADVAAWPRSYAAVQAVARP